MCPVASPYALRTICWIAAGSAVTLRSPDPPPAGTPAAASCRVIEPATWSASTAPSTETPIAPPSERKNATDALAAPMSRSGTVFCTASTRFCMLMPTPTPTPNMPSPTNHSGVSCCRKLSSANPPTSTTVPAMMYGLIRPVRLISRPATTEASSTPAISGIVSRPALVGE
jgi:hypothetical protein